MAAGIFSRPALSMVDSSRPRNIATTSSKKCAHQSEKGAGLPIFSQFRPKSTTSTLFQPIIIPVASSVKQIFRRTSNFSAFSPFFHHQAGDGAPGLSEGCHTPTGHSAPSAPPMKSMRHSSGQSSGHPTTSTQSSAAVAPTGCTCCAPAGHAVIRVLTGHPVIRATHIRTRVRSTGHGRRSWTPTDRGYNSGLVDTHKILWNECASFFAMR